MSALVYAYAILPTSDAASLDPGELRGVEGAPVRLVRTDELAAAVSDVSGQDYDEEPLNAHLGNLDWLGPRATGHQLVNDWLFERVPASLPLSFGSVFRSDDSLRKQLVAGRTGYAEQLNRIHDQGEWVVDVRREESLALSRLSAFSETLANLRQEIAAANPGRAFLLRKQIDSTERMELLRQDAEALGVAEKALTTTARSVYREPVVSSSGAGSIARFSVLVPRASRAELAQAVEAVRLAWEPRGYDIELTGPWPPYRFARIGAADDDDGPVS